MHRCIGQPCNRAVTLPGGGPINFKAPSHSQQMDCIDCTGTAPASIRLHPLPCTAAVATSRPSIQFYVLHSNMLPTSGPWPK